MGLWTHEVFLAHDRRDGFRWSLKVPCSPNHSMILIPDLQQRVGPFCCGALDTVEPCLLLSWDVLAPLPKGRQGKMSFHISLSSNCAKTSSTQKEERKGAVHVRFTPKILADVSLKRPSGLIWDLVGARSRPIFVLCKAWCVWFTESSTHDRSGAKWYHLQTINYLYINPVHNGLGV